MPVRRQKIETKFKFTKAKLVAFAIIFALLAATLFLFQSIISNKPEVVTVAIAHENGDIEVQMLDFTHGSITKVTVPAEAQVNLGMQRGVLRASAVWKLVESETLPGQILADTVMKTFHFPVDYWASEAAYGSLTNANSDVPLFLRIKSKILALRNSRVEEIKLSETSFLSSKKLTDGEEGYVIQGSAPLSLLSLFADSNISEGQTAVRIINKTGQDKYYLNDLVGIFATLGAKVAPIADENVEAGDCVVRAENKEVLARVASVFNCEMVHGKPTAFDIELTVGEAFYARF